MEENINTAETLRRYIARLKERCSNLREEDRRNVENLRRTVESLEERCLDHKRAIESAIERCTKLRREYEASCRHLEILEIAAAPLFNEVLSERKDIESHMRKIIVLDDAEVCSVCLQDMSGGGEDVVALKCSHTFHEKCMSEWSKRKSNCPLCRHDMRKDQQPKLKRRRLSDDDKEDVIDLD
ncbi:hypothetical protein MKW94_024338 [Papaver nudicaule]|uniref:RING-type domain-containing protein n=1 Tax=Papaver nudicaule TaxID=74823 RepID=A0AA41VS67_PAPNU|nr:hypothetical protein [Papaver nudicaule]